MMMRTESTTTTGAEPRQQTDQSRPAYWDTIPIPIKLLDNVHDNPLAVALYGVIARLYLIAQHPVPLSDRDIAAYDGGDPVLSRGAILRAIHRLEQGGWIITHTDGYKKRYMPAWGTIKGEVRSWQIHTPRLGKPKHIRTMRVPKSLLDDQIGRIAPHATCPARITRSNDAPTSTLREVGEQILNRPPNANGATMESPSPQTAHTNESQQNRPDMTPTSEAVENRPTIGNLFFVTQSLIGTMIAFWISIMIQKMIAQRAQIQATKTALGTRTKAVSETEPDESGESGESDEKEENIPPTIPKTNGVGEASLFKKNSTEGQSQTDSNRKQKEIATPKIPDTPAARLLHAEGFATSVVIELADLPIWQVQDVLYQAYTNPTVRSPIGWATRVLQRRQAEGVPMTKEDIPSAQSLLFAPRDSSAASACTDANVLHEAAESSDSAGIAEEPDTAGMDDEADTAVLDDVPEILEDRRDPLVRARDSGNLHQAWDVVLGSLHGMIMRSERDLLTGTQLVAWRDGQAIIGCPRVAQKEFIENRLMPALRVALDVPSVQCVLIRGE